MRKMLSLSIIIPVYDAEDTLNECIDSILSQGFHDFELLLIDDGSKDNSLIICENYAMKDRRVKIFHKENGGVSSARNMGLDKAQGKWITFIDADDYIEQGYFNNIIDETCDLVIKSYKELRNGQITIPAANVYNDAFLTIPTDVSNFISNYLSTMILRGPCGKFYRKELTHKLRFDQSMKIGEDSCFVFNYLTTVRKIRIQAGASYIIRCANINAREKYGCTTEYAVYSLKILYHSYLKLQKIHLITSASFLSYLGYFKLIAKRDWSRGLAKWYADPALKEMYQYVWSYLPFKQKVEYYILSKVLSLL